MAKQYCVIDAEQRYKTIVLVGDNEGVLYYEMQDGESLVDSTPPTTKAFAGGEGYVFPAWDGNDWYEAATAEEIKEWEAGHPAPALPEPEPTEDQLRITALEEENKLLTQQVSALSGQIDFQEECLVEMAGIVYA